MRNSSIRPENHSDQTSLPPMCRSPLVTVIAPVAGIDETSSPLISSRNVAPSYVLAMCDQVFNGSGAPLARASNGVETCALVWLSPSWA
jgi:hypothetical protein